jgi:hypothetical protein
MYIYKLKYTDKETAIADLLAKKVYVEVENLDKEKSLAYGQGIQAIVEIGLIVLENGTYDEDFNEITAPTYADGYHFDVMVTQAIDFGTARVTPTNVKHAFLGFNTNDYNETNQNTNTNETTTY